VADEVVSGSVQTYNAGEWTTCRVVQKSEKLASVKVETGSSCSNFSVSLQRPEVKVLVIKRNETAAGNMPVCTCLYE